MSKANPKGHPANPMSDREIEEKFLNQVDAVLPAKQSRTLLDGLWEPDKMNDISERDNHVNFASCYLVLINRRVVSVHRMGIRRGLPKQVHPAAGRI